MKKLKESISSFRATKVKESQLCQD